MKQILFVIVFFLAYVGFAQELNCQVSIIPNPALDVTTTEQEIFKELEKVIYELMNNTAWTKETFEIEEKINCNIVININSVPAPNRFSGSVQVQSTRPVFNSTYNSTVFNFLDEDLQFSFQRNAILFFAPNEFRDNLTSVLAFYAYMIIGYDYDTFSLEGGTQFFTQAQDIVVLAQNAGGSGWRSSERGRRNRYWLVDNALQQLFKPLRECFYEYHRLGLDKLYEDKPTARQNMYAALQKLTPVNNARPGSVNIQNFLAAKLKEIKNIYMDADQKDKTNVVNLLKRLDPANASKYQEILS
jgi:hypothetical protein